MTRRTNHAFLEDFEYAATVVADASPEATVQRLTLVPEGTVVIDEEPAAASVVQRDPTIVYADQGTIVMPPPVAPAEAPTRADVPGAARYVVVGVAGQGGMGTVHVARDIDLLRQVALKELSPAGAHDRGARSRFVREVQVTAQLDHPHIIPVYSLEVAAGGRPAYAMKLIEGRTFRQLIDETRACHAAERPADDALSLAARLEHFLKVCDAIDYAHARGVVHRDLKPANLMLGRHGEVYVMDWGICRVLHQADAQTAAVALAPAQGEDAGATALGTLIGTPLYMSPEQAQGRHADLDPRSDLCALGLILFELVTLQRPFTATHVLQVVQQAAAGDRAPIVHAWREAIAPELAAIIERASAFEPAKRYPAVRALAEDLRRFLRGDAVEARPDSVWQKLVRRLARRRQAVAQAVMAFAIVSLTIIAGLIWRHERTLEAQSIREHYTQAFVDDVAEIGDRLQTRVLEVRGELDALAAAVSQAAQHGREQPAVERAGQGAFIVLPGGRRADVAALAGRLHNVDAVQHEIVDRVQHALGSRTGTGATGGDVSGLHRLLFGFDAGLGYVFPSAGARGVADPRQETWYRAAKAAPGVDVQPIQGDADAARELAMTTAVRDDQGRAVGAVSMVLSLDNVLANLLAESPVRPVHGTWILAHDGRVLAAHADSPEQAAALLQQLSMPDLLQALESRDVGFIQTNAFGEPQLAAYDRIHPLGWVLLELASESELAARAPRD